MMQDFTLQIQAALTKAGLKVVAKHLADLTLVQLVGKVSPIEAQKAAAVVATITKDRVQWVEAVSTETSRHLPDKPDPKQSA